MDQKIALERLDTIAPLLKLAKGDTGFKAVDFWSSMDYGRDLPTDPKFFDDGDMHILAKNFKKFCESVATAPIKNYKIPPKNVSIPTLLHFIWLGSAIPPDVQAIIKTWEQCHSGWSLKIWQDKDLSKFDWVNGFSKIAFEMARTWAEKSDILRYEILYQQGGIYADVDTVCLKSFNDLVSHHVECFAGQETNRIGTKGGGALYAANGIIGVKKESPIIRHCLEHIKIQDEAPTEPIGYRTGPVLFSRALHEALNSKERDNILILPCSYFYPLPYFVNLKHTKLSVQEIMSSYIYPESMTLHLWWETWKKRTS